MQSNIDDFFISDKEVKLPEELVYSRAVEYIRSAEAFSRSAYQSVYIIDYIKRSFPYVSPLTEGEMSVITLSIQGYTMTEIDDKMCLSPETIKKYRKQIFEKLGVRNITEAIISATNHELL